MTVLPPPKIIVPELKYPSVPRPPPDYLTKGDLASVL